MADAEEYNTGDDVLAHHGPMIYQAKIMDKGPRQPKDGGAKCMHYKLHYQGWNKKWDEWVLPSRIMPLNDESRKKQQEHNAQQRGKDKERKLQKKAEKAKESAQSKKRKIDATRELEDDAGEAVVKLTIPFSLKKQLVDDWENVTREPRHLVPLPRKPTVSMLLEQYVEQKRKQAPGTAANFAEVCDGVKLYFDRALGTILLYRSERAQYDDLKAQDPDTAMSDVYGAEHLLRLFVRLPYLLAQTDLDETEMAQLQQKLVDLLKWLQKHQQQLFLKEYTPVDAEAAAGNGVGTTAEAAAAAAGEPDSSSAAAAAH